MKMFFLSLILFFITVGGTTLPRIAFADDPQTETYSAEVRQSLWRAGELFGRFESTELPSVVGYIVKGLLSILGVIFLALVVYGGFEWLTSAGDEKKVATALGIIQQGAIGLVIVLGAYIITSFVIGALQRAAGIP